MTNFTNTPENNDSNATKSGFFKDGAVDYSGHLEYKQTIADLRSQFHIDDEEAHSKILHLAGSLSARKEHLSKAMADYLVFYRRKLLDSPDIAMMANSRASALLEKSGDVILYYLDLNKTDREHFAGRASQEYNATELLLQAAHDKRGKLENLQIDVTIAHMQGSNSAKPHYAKAALQTLNERIKRLEEELAFYNNQILIAKYAEDIEAYIGRQHLVPMTKHWMMMIRLERGIVLDMKRLHGWLERSVKLSNRLLFSISSGHKNIGKIMGNLEKIGAMVEAKRQQLDKIADQPTGNQSA